MGYTNQQDMKHLHFGSDHGGFALKQQLLNHFETKTNLQTHDHGAFSLDPADDYPNFAHAVAQAIPVADPLAEPEHFGLLLCRTGQGMAMAANRHHHIRASIALDKTAARLSRAHNNANILVVQADFAPPLPTVIELVDTFLSTPFERGRHEVRVRSLSP